MLGIVKNNIQTVILLCGSCMGALPFHKKNLEVSVRSPMVREISEILFVEYIEKSPEGKIK